MIRLVIAAALFLAAIGPLRAETLTLDYQAVMHVRASNATPILDNPDHLVGIAEFRGLAIFADGEIAVHRYDGWFDLVKGSGKFHGYALWTFEDGSELRAPYSGTAEATKDGGVAVRAAFEDFSGSGRFTEATGTGEFSGRRIDAIDKGGSAYLQGMLRITLP
ncbi:hypothetical protein [Hoeflea poritis]|uniref:DUF3224 domain-containing protein n=1 Tax=Hoeflea poritis TaxID=2993659 RepID=A0ABT4VTP1_9HYPH|nr:hypothetical protein [Hoeflea poritis]MDA4848083.1 hypothetical protein [Hoeflea poritis]